MAAPDIVMYEEEFNQIKQLISKFRTDANANVVFLVDKNGQQIAAHGDIENLDTIVGHALAWEHKLKAKDAPFREAVSA